tara:strand:- start:1517 stop:1744 length:228 start_codon:yes stop_codon:yes gene_type:complete
VGFVARVVVRVGAGFMVFAVAMAVMAVGGRGGGVSGRRRRRSGGGKVGRSVALLRSSTYSIIEFDIQGSMKKKMD